MPILFRKREERIGGNLEMKTIEEQIAELEAKIAELKKPKRVAGWRPEVGEEYCFVDTLGLPKYCVWDNDEVDFWRLSQNNVFRTREDAFAYGRISFRAQELIEQGERIDWKDETQSKFYFGYNFDTKRITNTCTLWQKYQGTTYFLKPEFEKIRDEFDDDTLMLFVGLR